MDIEAVVIWVVLFGVFFFIVGKVSIQIFKFLFIVATGISVVGLVVLSPVLVIFLGVKGFKHLVCRVWGFKERVPKASAAVTERLESKED